MLPREIARKIRHFEVRGRKLVESGFGGEYRSVFRGRGVEFDEVRPYVAGDDVRLIDWNVTARTGEPYIKKHVEEREQTVVFAVDVSASSHFGSRGQTKRELAAEVCCVLAVTAAVSGDRTGLLLFSDRVERYIPPGRALRHALSIVRHLLGHEPESTRTDVAHALRFLSRVLRRRAVLFLVSDFVSPAFERPLKIAACKHDVIALTTADAYEHAMPPIGLSVMEDAETGERVAVDYSDPGVRTTLAARAAEAALERQATFARAGGDSIQLKAGAPYEQALHRLFESRTRRIRNR